MTKAPAVRYVDDIARVGDGFNRLFGSLLGESILPAYGEKFWHPVIDINQTEKEICVRVELPGVDEKDISISVEESRLTISGERKTQEEYKESNQWYSEMTFGSFHRIIDLPDMVTSDKAEAKFEKGLLTVTIPRSEKAKSKKVKILVVK